MLGALVALALVVTLVAQARVSLLDADPGPAADDVALPAASRASSSSTTSPGSTASASTTIAPEDVQEVVPAERLQRKPEPATKGGRDPLARQAEAEAQDEPFDVRIGTFNVLGSQHTAAGGDRRRYPAASTRSPAAASLLLKHGVDIVGAQELQADQLAALTSRLGFAAYPGTAWGSAETDNSILYDPDRFEFVSGSHFTITFMGRARPQPILKLRERATGREFYVINTHPSAHGGRYATERRNGWATLVSIVQSLKGEGLPILVTGDMNDREAFYCAVVSPAGMTAANGGGSGCAPPPSPVPVDWVVGYGVSWTGYWRDTTPVNRRISDHFLVSATAHVE